MKRENLLRSCSDIWPQEKTHAKELVRCLNSRATWRSLVGLERGNFPCANIDKLELKTDKLKDEDRELRAERGKLSPGGADARG